MGFGAALRGLLGTEYQAPAVRREPIVARVKGDAYVASNPLSTAGGSVYAAFNPMGNHAGVSVTPLSAMQSTAVFACIRCLSEDFAKLPVEIMRRLDGGWQVDHEHPLADLFRRPNRWQSCYTFFSYVVTCLQLRGNAYVLVVRDEDGAPRSLIPISPDRCTMRLSAKGWLFYDVGHPAFGSGNMLTVHQDDMLHIRSGVSLDGFTGLSPIAAHAEAIGLSLAMQQHGANLFRNGTQATGVLETPDTLTPTAASNLKESFAQRYSGVENAHKVLVLEEGLKFSKLSMTAEESQFLEARGFQVEEVCRIFRTPPHKIAKLDRATFSNIENQNQQYIDDSLVPMAAQGEQEMEHKLLWERDRRRIRIRFSFDGLLRGDMKTRFDAYHLALGDGWMNRDAVRARENMPPIPGGEGQQYRVALNTGDAAATDKPPAVTGA